MEKIRRISRKYYLRQIVACWMILSMLVVMPLNTAMAGPPVYTPVITDSGGANVTQSNMFTGIEVVTQETIMTSSNFNTLVGETVDFSQAEGISGAAVLNKISGGPTDYQGNLYSESDMSIFLINPAGILFGGGAVINTGALVASSLNLTDDDFREGLDTGVFNFTDGANAGIVENHGSISAETIALIGKTVLNTGALNGDYVVMAAGDTVKITGGPDLGDIIVEVTVPADWESGDDAYWVDHGDEGSGGSIDAQQVVLAAGDIWSSAAINAYS
ncbi:MAG: filamentous hemagglutinin N-terminal domain-containing protein, partial [Planctomycetes bacterium]|nr:filamentous hemagglutinin N-terminal domain-containing protein [Planctomycetota bacterium]